GLCSGAARPGIAGSPVCRRASGLGNRQRAAGRPETGIRACAGPRQRRQGATGSARTRRAGCAVSISRTGPAAVAERKSFADGVCPSRRRQADAPASLADGERGFGFGAPRQPAHAPPQLRHTHGGKRRRSAHGADHPGARRHFHEPDLHPRGSGPIEERVSQVSPPGQKARDARPTMKTVKGKKETGSSAIHPEIGRGIKKFLASLHGERNVSAHTLRAYSNELNRFASYLGPEIGWKDIDHTSIRGFLSHLHNCGLSKVSVARALAVLRSMYNLLSREGIVRHNPAKLVATPKLPKKLPRVPTLEEMNGLLDSAMPENAAFPERDRAIFELLYGCGLRNSELVGIELGDV